jgi:hypothetical protein
MEINNKRKKTTTKQNSSNTQEEYKHKINTFLQDNECTAINTPILSKTVE